MEKSHKSRTGRKLDARDSEKKQEGVEVARVAVQELLGGVETGTLIEYLLLGFSLLSVFRPTLKNLGLFN